MNPTTGFNFQGVPKVNLSSQHKQNQLKLTQGFFKDFEHWVLDNDPAAPACQDGNIFFQKPSSQSQLSWNLGGSANSTNQIISTSSHPPVQPMLFGQSSISSTSTASSQASNDTALTSTSSLFKPFHELMGITSM